MFWLLLIKALYFFLPAYGANMAPTLFKWIPLGNKPIYEQKLGSHKTWRGLIVGTLVGGFIFSLQKYFYSLGYLNTISLLDYKGFSILLGFLMGFGALFGDVIKSYYKRRVHIKPGDSWMPWDQLDFVFGGLVVSFLMYVPPIEVILILVIVSPLLHIIVNNIGYLLKIRETRF